jgi:hypothetical protein
MIVASPSFPFLSNYRIKGYAKKSSWKEAGFCRNWNLLAMCVGGELLCEIGLQTGPGIEYGRLPRRVAAKQERGRKLSAIDA